MLTLGIERADIVQRDCDGSIETEIAFAVVLRDDETDLYMVDELRFFTPQNARPRFEKLSTLFAAILPAPY